MTDYDALAESYDGHFRRAVDMWEDDYLTRLLRPIVNGRSVLDLGCGTGWVLDHLAPRWYLGVDSSSAMLDRLREKHPCARSMKLDLREPWDAILSRQFDVVVSTWAAHELGHVTWLAARAKAHAPILALHGQAPRYRHRRHYIATDEDEGHGYLNWRPDALPRPETWRIFGCGALPDRLAFLGRRAWELALWLPASRHYSFLAVHP